MGTGRRGVTDDVLSELEAWGAPSEVITAQEQSGASVKEIGIWPENWEIVTAFSVIATQWRVAALATMASARIHYIGLDYSAVRAGLAGEKVRITQDLWRGIRTMEAAAMIALNDR